MVEIGGLNAASEQLSLAPHIHSRRIAMTDGKLTPLSTRWPFIDGLRNLPDRKKEFNKLRNWLVFFSFYVSIKNQVFFFSLSLSHLNENFEIYKFARIEYFLESNVIRKSKFVRADEM